MRLIKLFRWIDTIPIARIIARCTTDKEVVDDRLANSLSHFVELACTLIVALAAVFWVAGWSAILMGIAVSEFGFVYAAVYLKSQLSIKRENSIGKSHSEPLALFSMQSI